MTHRLVIAALVVGTARLAEAHFNQSAPTTEFGEATNGNPQLSAPCGQADPSAAAVPTNAVTTLMEGDTIQVTFVETIFHPGHYRVAIAADQSSLPADPPVTAGSTPCGTTVIDGNPAPPVLGDGLLVHTTSFGTAPQTMNVRLPAGFTCDHCVLQTTEFMSNHGLNVPGGCFYHHCAIVTVAAHAPDAGPIGADSTPSAPAGGCCETGGAMPGAPLALGVLAMLVRRRRATR